jgi:hypothetical protein
LIIAVKDAIHISICVCYITATDSSRGLQRTGRAGFSAVRDTIVIGICIRGATPADSDCCLATIRGAAIIAVQNAVTIGINVTITVTSAYAAGNGQQGITGAAIIAVRSPIPIGVSVCCATPANAGQNLAGIRRAEIG